MLLYTNTNGDLFKFSRDIITPFIRNQSENSNSRNKSKFNKRFNYEASKGERQLFCVRFNRSVLEYSSNLVLHSFHYCVKLDFNEPIPPHIQAKFKSERKYTDLLKKNTAFSREPYLRRRMPVVGIIVCVFVMWEIIMHNIFIEYMYVGLWI